MATIQEHEALDYVKVTGLWMRREGDRVTLLAEVGGQWRRVADNFSREDRERVVEIADIAEAPIEEIVT